MIKSYIVAEINANCNSLHNFHKQILTDLISILSQSGIESSKIQRKCETLFFICNEKRDEVYISMFNLYAKNLFSDRKCFILFSNYLPQNKGDSSDKEYYEGVFLNKIKLILSEFLEKDKRFTELLWLNRDEYLGYLKKVPDFGHF